MTPLLKKVLYSEKKFLENFIEIPIFVKKIVMYRIKIDQLNNGEKRYTPQVGKLKVSGKWIQKQEIVWENIINESFVQESYAIKVIEEHRKIQDKKHGSKIKSTTFRIID